MDKPPRREGGERERFKQTDRQRVRDRERERKTETERILTSC